MKMKIVHVTNYFKPSWESGGVTRVVYELTKELVKKGHEVVVLTTDGFKKRLDVETSKPVIIDGVKVYYFRNLSMWFAQKNITIPLKSKKIIQKEISDCDVVHIHEHRSLLAYIASKAALDNSKPYVIQPHGSMPENIGRSTLKIGFDKLIGYNIINNSNKIIAITLKEKKELEHLNNTTVIPIGFDKSIYGKNIERGKFRKKMKITKSDLIILYIGRLHKIKGLDILINSVKILKKYRSCFKIVIAGPDDGFKNKLKRIINENDLNNFVMILGPLYDIEKIEALSDSDIFILPSRYETFPVSLFEAGCFNLPVITTNKCGIANSIKNNTGLVVKLNEKEIADAIIKLIDNENIRKKYGKNNKKQSDNHSWVNIIEIYEKVYQHL